jgi:hypothetical protein
MLNSVFTVLQASHKSKSLAKDNDVESSSDENSSPEEDVRVRLGGT